MKLFIQDEQGQYVTATNREIIKEGRSRTRSTLKRGTEFIGSSQAAKEAIASKIFSYQHEVFGCLFLDTKNTLIADEEQAKGTVNHVPVYPREVVKRALELGATAIILVHNHPSGDPAPSPEDVATTHRLVSAGDILGIRLLDHVVVGEEGFVSMKHTGIV